MAAHTSGVENNLTYYVIPLNAELVWLCSLLFPAWEIFSTLNLFYLGSMKYVCIALFATMDACSALGRHYEVALFILGFVN